ncbi:DUF4276 family protein [Cyanobacterium aponinum UTEX 3222]|uniref:DUF4276 family protein n=1 Tax=Cyanobacterium aponinum TaxID=379064 RepID=UPI000C12C3E8|nr:DUF4276 family protein [Cyanobacterium aponinum]PHV63005.1 hypothetical protein CSQ80_07335 [Cyanobacterium aponinum IPPAS B-1201]WRL41219.1 DUF4276 family protein [Cyanobacterium aponinum UTEX 3222]
MSYDLIFLLEEPSLKDVLEIILPKIIPIGITYICISHQGKQDLAKSIPIKIKAFKFSPHTQFIIVHDQDSHDCKQLKSELVKICRIAGKEDAMIRIICHELESWFLGDLLAVEKAYNLPENTLSKKQTYKKFRNPDQLNSAKQELRNLVKEYYPGTHSKKIAPYLSLQNNKSRSFLIFLKGIMKVCEFILHN